MSDSHDLVELITGDITTLRVDAIVNAANESLLGGGGVDGAIHRAAGPELKAHNRTLGGCPTGAARITPGFKLARHGIDFIIHAVGPVWRRSANVDAPVGDVGEDVFLARCYRECLTLAESNGVRTLAFPAISTGVYGFPKQRAARIAVAQVRKWVPDHDLPHRVVFCCFSDADSEVYRAVLDSFDA